MTTEIEQGKDRAMIMRTRYVAASGLATLGLLATAMPAQADNHTPSALRTGASASAPAAQERDMGAAQPANDVHLLADHEMYTADQSWPYDPAGHMWFNEYGDVVTLCDNDADDQKVHLAVTYDGNRYGMSVGGEGNCVTRRASDGGQYNLPENQAIAFEIHASGDPEGSYNQASWVNDN